ncbi:MAG: ribose-phosphate pyrophosphokinase [Candidatus Marinimicrobia bacterium]|nr:ribose-phosphate pyrophosphokinase [Candidatus Neomarinimicrobiota bacterium]
MMKIFAGRSNLKLAQAISMELDIPLGPRTIKNFSDGEIYVKFEENIRNEDVFIIQSTNPPADYIIELLLMLDAARRASAGSVTAVIPYYGYARQDRKDKPRVPISARLFLDTFEAVGASRVITMDLHSPQIQGFVNIPFDHLYSRLVLLERLKKLGWNSENGIVLSPDMGSARMGQAYARYLDLGFALIDKRRPAHNRAEVVHLIGNLKDKHVIIIDDMIDTAGTIVSAAESAMEHGAKSITAVATHGLFSKPATERLMAASIDKVIVTDTIDVQAQGLESKLEIVSVAKIFAASIQRITAGRSLSSLFEMES